MSETTREAVDHTQAEAIARVWVAPESLGEWLMDVEYLARAYLDIRAAAPSPGPDADTARLVTVNADAHREVWRDKPDAYWLMRLMQEVGELASALADDHEHSPEHELAQVGGIATNWLRLRAARRVEGA